jgi:hypothetical protein
MDVPSDHPSPVWLRSVLDFPRCFKRESELEQPGLAKKARPAAATGGISMPCPCLLCTVHTLTSTLMHEGADPVTQLLCWKLFARNFQ